VELLTTLFPVWVCCTRVYEGFVFFCQLMYSYI
jgi:hypothetical protein